MLVCACLQKWLSILRRKTRRATPLAWLPCWWHMCRRTGRPQRKSRTQANQDDAIASHLISACGATAASGSLACGRTEALSKIKISPCRLGEFNIQKSHGSILTLRSRWKRGEKTVHEGEALPFRSQQQSLRATALQNRPAEGANMTRRPGLAHLHGEERWRWLLR